MLAIVSDIPRAWEHRRQRGNASQAMEQLDMFKPVSKWQVYVSDPTALEDIFDQGHAGGHHGQAWPRWCFPCPMTWAIRTWTGPGPGSASPTPPSPRFPQRARSGRCGPRGGGPEKGR